jgi:hypothetical protein
MKEEVIVPTSTNDPRDVDACHSLGCSQYIVKPVEYDKFARVLGQLGLSLKIIQVLHINGVDGLTRHTGAGFLRWWTSFLSMQRINSSAQNASHEEQLGAASSIEVRSNAPRLRLRVTKGSIFSFPRIAKSGLGDPS